MFLESRSRGVAALVVSAVLGALVSATLGAQTPAVKSPAAARPATKADSQLPPARELIDRYVKAIGGREAVLGHKSLHVTGTYAVPSSGMVGTLEAYSAANPNRSLQRVAIPGLGEIASGFDGEHGWTVNPMTGAMLQQGRELEQARLDAEFYSELRDPRNYKSITTVEKTTFEGRPCYKVSLVRADGAEDFDFYDVETGLRGGSIITRESPMGTVTSTNVESDYRKFGNLLQPTTVLLKTMGVEQKLTLVSAEFDKVDPAVFDPPAAIKALIK